MKKKKKKIKVEKDQKYEPIFALLRILRVLDNVNI